MENIAVKSDNSVSKWDTFPLVSKSMELNNPISCSEFLEIKSILSIDKELSKFEATEIVHTIGGVALIYRPARKAYPALSNIVRTKLL